jgi:hypothetical protein
MNDMETKRLKLPYGIADFAKIRQQGYYYVDRSSYIRTLEDLPENYLVFLRPRRFGKSLFLSLLNYYYGSIYKEQFDEFFAGLNIHENPTPLKNSYAILKFDFSGILTDSHDNSVHGFSSAIRRCILVFLKLYFPELSQHENVPPIEAGAENILEYALSSIQMANSSKKVYVLIDEYDHFANEILSFRYNEYLESVAQNGFVRKFYEKLKTFAGNGVIDRIFITGVSPITLDSLTSGFNISTHITLDEDFHAMVGFTEAEAGELLARSFPAEQIYAVMNDCKKWYDGYRFSEDTEERIFNPDMLLYFLRYVEKRNSYPKDMLDKNVASDYTKIQKIFSIGNENANLEELNTLIREKQLKSTLVSEFSLQKRFEREDFISILFYSGILTIDQSYNELIQFKMPNLVLEKLYLEFFIRSIANRADITLNTDSLKVALHELSQNGNLQIFLTLVEELLQKLSNRDFMNFDEKYVKAIICSYLSLSNLYMVKSEYELPESYADLVFFQREPYKVKYQFLFELKYCKKDSPKKIINELAKEGRKQLQKYCESEEIAGKMANKDCPLKPYLIIFSGCKLSLCEPFTPANNFGKNSLIE